MQNDKHSKRFLNVYRFFTSQLGLLEELYQYQFYELDKLPKSRLHPLYFVLFALQRTGVAISTLSQHGYIGECYMLARAFLERLIIYLYLLSCDDCEFQRYISYTKQKGFRILDRSIVIGDMKVHMKASSPLDIEKDPELKKALELFTSKGGKPLTRWTHKSIADMLGLLSKSSDLNIGILLLAYLGIYDDASEALHGTLYGSLFHTGIFTKELTIAQSELRATWEDGFTWLFLSLGVCVDVLIKGIDKFIDVKDLLSRSDKNVKGVQNWFSVVK